MTRRGRGSTGPGRAAATPPGVYAPAPPPDSRAEEPLLVTFDGDDGRHASFDVSTLPLPGWHPGLAAAFASRTGPAGGLRTLSSASNAWGSLGRLIRFLAALPQPPATPGQLTSEHLTAFDAHRIAVAPSGGHQDLARARLFFTLTGLRGQVSTEVLDHLQRRRPAPHGPRPCAAGPAGAKGATFGYSDGELARLMAALRTDAAAIRDRIRAGEDLLRRYREHPSCLSQEEHDLAAVLEGMAATGRVPAPPGDGVNRLSSGRARLAGHLFLTLADLPPLMLLAAALCERNGETIKELPVAHRLLEGRAVELIIVKRRRGASRWFETVTWEIGPPGRELHTPGGFYLLLLELTARSRALSDSPLLWRVWRNGHSAGLADPDDHLAPFEASLRGTPILPTAWAAHRPRPLLADPQGPDDTGSPLQVSFNRIKTSMEVRRTKRMGGHLPSAAKSNTMPVLFRNYLSGDPVIISWAQEVLSEALVDAEQAAQAAHQRAVAAAGEPRALPGPTNTDTLHAAGLAPATAQAVAGGGLDTGWTACTDHDHHPLTGRECQASFLDCFHCGNALITRDHLPRLLGLIDALAGRRRQLSQADWWARYGPAWVAVRQDILTKFTPAELARARSNTPDDALLDLIENPWETP